MSIWDTLIGKQEVKTENKEFKYVNIFTGADTAGDVIYTTGTQTSGTNPYNNPYANTISPDDLTTAIKRIEQMQKAQMQPKEKSLHTLTLSALSGEAGRASLDELRDLWRARWGDKWVKREEIDGDFFEVAVVRLLSSNRLETHSLGDGITVYRLL